MSRKKEVSFKVSIALCIIMFTTNINSFSQDKKTIKDIFSVSGYVKYLNTVNIINKDTVLSDNLLHNRINIKGYFSDNLEMKLEVRNRLFYGESMKFNPFFAENLDYDDGLVDMSFVLLDGKSMVLHSKIDRAFLNYYKGKFDIRVGRQRINWGVNTVWNPNDLFNALNFLDFDYEERPGTDAVRIQYNTSDNSNLDFAYKFDEDFDKSILALMYKFNKWKYDFQVFGGNYQTDITAGLGWAGNLKKAGFKGELSYFYPRMDSVSCTFPGISIATEEVLSSSIAIDYSFKNGFYINGSFLFNSLGINEKSPINSQGIFSERLSPKNLMPTKYSCLIQTTKNFGPAWNTSLAIIYGQGMNLVVILPTVSYAIKENWDLDLTGQTFFIEQDKLVNAGNSVSLRVRFSY